MNPERLADLQRQRALVREQLAWLDREIAAVSGTSPVSPVAAPAETTLPPAVETLRPDPAAAAAATKRGCLLAFAGVLLIGALGLAALYFIRYRDRPLFFAEKEPAPPAAVVPAKASAPQK